MGALAAALGAAPVTAYHLTGHRFDHTAITYSCNAPEDFRLALREWAKYSGITDGGCEAPNPDITFRPTSPWPYGEAAGVAGCESSEGITLRCFVAIRPGLDPRLVFPVAFHELGHALGLGHSCELAPEYPEWDCARAPWPIQEAAMAPYCCNTPTSDDIAGIQELYGPPAPGPRLYRLFAPAVSR